MIIINVFVTLRSPSFNLIPHHLLMMLMLHLLIRFECGLLLSLILAVWRLHDSAPAASPRQSLRRWVPSALRVRDHLHRLAPVHVSRLSSSSLGLASVHVLVRGWHWLKDEVLLVLRSTHSSSSGHHILWRPSIVSRWTYH